MITPDDERVTSSLIGVCMAIVGSMFIGFSYTASKTAHNIMVRDLKKRMSEDASVSDDGGVDDPLLASSDQETTELPSEDRHETTGLDSEETLEVPLLAQENAPNHHPVPEYSMSSMVAIPVWWFGIVLLLTGEIFNFMAYGFAPTSVIAPLGTLSIISGALSGYLYLGERIKSRNVGGIVLSMVGATVIVISGKDEEPQLDPDAILNALSQTRFIIYVVSVSAIAGLLMFLDNWRPDPLKRALGDRYMVIRVMLTAIFSGFTVLATKSISSLLGLEFYKIFAFWISYVLIAVLIIGALATLYFTNKALSSFDSTQVLPSEFAAYTLTAVLGSAILYGDFDTATWKDIVTFIAGCLITFCGTYFITSDAAKFGKRVGERESVVIMAGAFPVPVTPDMLPTFLPSPTHDDEATRPRGRIRPLTHPASYGSTGASGETGEPSHLQFVFPSANLLQSSPSAAGKPHRFYLAPKYQNQTNESTFAGALKRISQLGFINLVSAVHTLGSSTRASRSFEQVVNLPSNAVGLAQENYEQAQTSADEEQGQQQADVPTSIVVVTPVERRREPSVLDDVSTIRSFEVMSRHDKSDEVSFFVRPIENTTAGASGETDYKAALSHISRDKKRRTLSSLRNVFGYRTDEPTGSSSSQP